MLTLAGCLQSLWAVDVTVTMNNVSKTMSLVNKTTSAPVEVGEPASNKYTFSCDEGTYVLTAYATDGTTVNDTIELNVFGDAADFTVFTCTAYATNSDWALGTDYNVEVSVASKMGDSRVITTGVNLKNQCTFPVLNGDSYYAEFIPSAARAEEGYVNLYRSGTVTFNATASGAIPMGLDYSVTVPAEAEVAGYRGNIKIRTAVVPVSVPSEIDQVRNTSLFTGGADRESDTTLRRRIQDSYYNQPNGMNAAYYIALAESVDGIFKAGVVPRGSGTGSVDVYVCGGNESVLPEEKLTEAENFLKSQRELNVSVKVKQAYSVAYDLDVAVTPKPGYSQEEVVELCTDAFEAYIETIPIGGKFYLATLGKYLLDTGCLETYVFDLSMGNMTIPMSKYFVAGDINIEVTSA